MSTSQSINPRIIFMGTPEFAVASLDALVNAGCNIVGVITAPDRPAGRGMQLQQSAVKKYAVEKGLHILQPEKLKNPAFLEELKNLQADLQVVVAFRMLPEVVWNMPRLGTINLHASLLPQYRGAAPINWAVINGEKETGVTTFKLQHEIDTGNILLQEKITIGENETAGELHDRMKIIGSKLLVKTVEALAVGMLEPIPQDQLAQDPSALKHAPKIFTETCRIDWNKPADQIFNLIRGLSPYPAAFTYLDGKLLKIFKASKEQASPGIEPGQYEVRGQHLRFASTDGYIYAEEVQPEGKKRMKTEDFLRGWRR
ncbi:MAG TPA: methionyl-tRNA formyltransferase [Chitinophagaceae bacterium]|nr:methionyl-tRNA formyltransferase [Chitinophagaceae bacterium]